MIKLLWFISPLILLLPQLYSATLTVDNSPGSVAQYSSLAAAISAASPGDTLLIAGSPNHYGDHNIYKQLHFVGVGYFLGANSIPGLTAELTGVHLRFRKDTVTGDSSGSSIAGVTGLYSSDAGVSSLTVDKCYSAGHNWSFNGPVTITRVYTPTTIDIHAATSSVSNSIAGYIRLRISGTTATNCVVRQGIGSSVSGSSFTNTVFMFSNGNEWTGAPDFTFSLCIGSSFLPEGNGNINGQLTADVFTQAGSIEWDRYYILTETSVAKGAGFGGDDIGAYGGSDPYVISGVPGRPRMTRFNAPGTATGLTAVTIEVEAEAFPE